MVVEASEELLKEIASSSYEMADLRSLMPDLSTEELAVAGHAVALNHWHKVCALVTRGDSAFVQAVQQQPALWQALHLSSRAESLVLGAIEKSRTTQACFIPYY